MCGHHDAESLVVVCSLRGPAVATGNDNSRDRPVRIRKVKVCRDSMARLAVKNDTLNAISVAGNRPDGLGVKSSSLWQATQLLEKELP